MDDLSVRSLIGVRGMVHFSSSYLIHDILTQLLDWFRTCWFVLDLHLVVISSYLVVVSVTVITKSTQLILTPRIYAGLGLGA